MFIAALFTTANTWKWPKCPSIEERTKVQDTYTMEFFLTVKKERNNAIYSNMDGPRYYHTK